METLTVQRFRFDEFELDRVKRLLLRNGEPVALNPKAFELLLVLVEARGEVLSKDHLLERVWPDQIVEEGNLKVHVSALRKTLGERGNEHRFIVTVPGRGYSFVADLETSQVDEIVVESHTYSHVVVENAEETTSQALLTPSQRVRKLLLVALLLLLPAGVGFAYWFLRASPATSTSIESIAVMPFSNESGNADIEYLSDGMTESLIISLSKLTGLSVKARSTVFRYKGKDISPADVGSELSVQAILLGRVIQRGDQLTLYLSLVDARTGNQIWGDQYDRMMTDLVSLQNEIARDVSGKLKSKLSGADEQKLATKQTADPEAYQLYLKGRYFWNKWTPADHLKAIDYFNRAIERDPEYASAYSGLAGAYGGSAVNGWIPPNEAYPKAKAAMKKALELDINLAEAHAGLGAMYMFADFNWDAAEKEFKLSIELDPNNEIAHQLYSYLLSGRRRHDEAIAEAQRAREIDPLSATLSDDLALAYNLARRYDEALKQNQKTLEMEPDRPDSIYRIGTIYDLKGMYAEALAACEKAMSLSERTSTFLGCMGHAYAASGRRDEANKILSELKNMSKQSYVSPYDLAIIYAGLGEKEKAVAELERSFDEQSGWMINLRVDPFLDSLRDDVRFQKLIARSGL